MEYRPWRKPRSETFVLHPDVELWVAEQIKAIKRKDTRANLWTMLTFLCRKHSGPRVIGRSFVLDRRELGQLDDLPLTESQSDTARQHLERVGILVRVPVIPGHSLFQRPTEGRGACKKPIHYRLCSQIISIIHRIQLAIRRSVGRKRTSTKDKSVQTKSVPMAQVASFKPQSIVERRRIIELARSAKLFHPSSPRPGEHRDQAISRITRRILGQQETDRAAAQARLDAMSAPAPAPVPAAIPLTVGGRINLDAMIDIPGRPDDPDGGFDRFTSRLSRRMIR